MTRRRSIGEGLAPWVLMTVLVALWWAGAGLVRWSGLFDRAPQDPPAAFVPAGDATQPRDPVTTLAPRDVAGPTDARDPSFTPAASPDDDAGWKKAEASPGALAVVTFHDLSSFARALTVPVQGVTPEALVPTYRDSREGARQHEAMDIVAPRGTPVLAVEDGRIAKLFTSARGGLTIYQFDPAEQFAYDYAHLDGYAAGLHEGAPVQRGQTLGTVGTTGNAPPDSPHLHFAIFKLGPDRRWWQGTPLDPYIVWR